MMATEVLWSVLMLLLTVYTIAQHAIEYTFNTEKATWNQAQTYCMERGARLVTLKTEEEFQRFINISEYLQSNGDMENDDLWFGLFDNSPPHMKYTWTDCTPLSPLFSPWDTLAGEPNYFTTEQCIRVTADSLWRSTRCYLSKMFACERDVGNCWYEKVDGRPVNITVLCSHTLDDCKSACLKRSRCLAVQFIDGKCRASQSKELMSHDNEVAYRKVCFNYTITDDKFTLENPRIWEGTLNCSAISTAMQSNIELTTDQVQSNLDTTLACDQQGSDLTVDLHSTLNSSTGDIAVSSLTENLHSTLDQTAESLKASSMASDSFSTAINLKQTFSSNTQDIQVPPIYPAFDTLSAEQPLMTEDVRPTRTTSIQPQSSSLAQPTTEITTTTTTPAVTTKCTCVCKLTTGEVGARVSNITKELTLNTTNLSSYRRKKSSAKDTRRSATASGVLGIAVFVLSGLGLVFLDVLTFAPILCGK